MLTEKEVTEYQEIYKKVYWKEISREEALTQGISLVTFLEAIYKGNGKEK
jgi:lysozyme family protein